jgi:hypothetical protein
MNHQKSLHGEVLVTLLIEDNPAHAELIRRHFEAYRIANIVKQIISWMQDSHLVLEHDSATGVLQPGASLTLQSAWRNINETTR